MKKLFMSLFLLALFLVGCSKDEKPCWDCYLLDVITREVIEQKVYCDLTLEELKATCDMKSVPGQTTRHCYNMEFPYVKPRK